MRVAIAVIAVIAACSSPPPSPPSPSPPPHAVVPADAAADDIAPLPYTAEQLRAASPAGRVIALRVEVAGKPATIHVIEFVASDDRGADIVTTERDDQGREIGAARRQHTTWDELRHHAAFPRARTTISDGVADTPAGRFPSKIYAVTNGDDVTHYYFANDRPGPPVMFYTDTGGSRAMTTTLLAEPPPAPVACTTDDDCWLDGLRPIARPRSERGKRVRPCKDAERVPACKDRVCVVVGYKC